MDTSSYFMWETFKGSLLTAGKLLAGSALYFPPRFTHGYTVLSPILVDGLMHCVEYSLILIRCGVYEAILLCT